MVQVYRVCFRVLFFCLWGFALPSNSYAAELVTIDIPCLDNSGNIRNGRPGVTYCKNQFKKCSDQNNEIRENLRKNLAAVIAGRYIGLQINTQASTEERPVGKPWNKKTCSVVGQNLKEFINGNVSLAEIDKQKIYRQQDCGKIPLMTLTKGYMESQSYFDIGIKNEHGTRWVSYMNGASDWAIKRIAYEYFQKLGSQPIKISAACAHEGGSLQGTGSTSNRLEQALSTLVENLNQSAPNACNDTNPNSAINCSAPSTNPAAPAYCNMKMISQLLFNSKFEQQLTCQILKDAAILSDLTVGYVFVKSSSEAPNVDPSSYESDVLNTVLKTSISKDAQKYFVGENGTWSGEYTGSILGQLNRKVLRYIRDDKGKTNDNDSTYESELEERCEKAAGKAAATLIGQNIKQVGSEGDQLGTTSISGAAGSIWYTLNPPGNLANSAAEHEKWYVVYQGASKLEGFQGAIELIIRNEICAADAAGNNKCDPALINVSQFEGQGSWR